MWGALAVWLSAGDVRAQADSRSVTVEYLANEGVLLVAGGRAILIDGLFGDGLPAYPVVEPARRDSLERALGRFGEIDAVLVTHVHKDHFDARAVARHLAANPGARLIGPTQAADTLRMALGELGALRARVHPVHLAPGDTAGFVVEGVAIRAVGLVHPPSRNDPVELVGYRVALGGVSVAHVGDASPSPADLAPLRDVDLLLAPWWIVLGARGAERIEASGARRAAAFHLDRDRSAEEIHGRLADGVAVEVLDRAGILLSLD